MAMTMDRLNLEGLRYAQAVAETKSFSAAARAYGVTQPALSNGIAKLEERLGDKLFDRSPRGVTRTAFGVRILPTAVPAHVPRALSEELLVRDGGVQVLPGIRTVADAQAYPASGLFSRDVVGGLSPLLKHAPDTRVHDTV